MRRRLFLRNSALAMAGVGVAPPWLARTAFGIEPAEQRRKILVAIFLRGAADGLNMVVPYMEQRYYSLRPNIAVPKPGEDGGGIDLDTEFALHPSLRPLKPLFDEKQLAIVHAAADAH